MFAPASARKLLVVKNLPALISVTSGRPASSSFRSTQKTPVARSSTARTACEAISLTSARCTVGRPRGSALAARHQVPEDVLESLSRSGRDELAVLPDALERELAAGEELADHEVRVGETPPLDPVLGPGDGLIRRRDGKARSRARSADGANPGQLPALENRCRRLTEERLVLRPSEAGVARPASDNRAAKAACPGNLHGLSREKGCSVHAPVLPGQKEHLLLGLRVDELGFLGVDHGVQLAEIVRVVGRGRR